MNDPLLQPTGTERLPTGGEDAATQSFEVASADPTVRCVAPVVSTPNDRLLDTPIFPHIPGFRILGELGRGGMGVVYEAVQERLGRRVALKLMRVPHESPGLRKRLESEATIHARLEHRNVVPVYDAGKSDPWLYFAMRLIRGGSLKSCVARFRTDAGTVVRLMAKIAAAVEYLHGEKIWHRDLKPQNILVDDDDEPLVSDFGVAKWLDGDDHTRGFTRVGTYAYMAPEMVEWGSNRSGPLADVWSLGVMLYELLAGVRPFPGDNSDATLPERIVTDAPPPFPGAVLPGTDANLEAVVLKALAKAPADRYRSAAAFADDLNNWLTGGSMDTLPLPELRRKAERNPAAPQRRRRMLAALAVVLALAGVSGAAAFWREDAKKPTPTLAEVLRDKGEAVLVDENGVALFPPTRLEGGDGNARTTEDGYLEVTGAPKGLFEFGDAPAMPFRFQAKVSHLWGDIDSHVGIYARRASHPSPAGRYSHHALFAVSIDTHPVPPEAKWQGRAITGGGWVDPNSPTVRGWFRFSKGPGLQLDRHPATGPSEPVRYTQLDVIVTADGPATTVAGTRLAATPWALLEGGMKSALRQEERIPPQILWGDGFGLSVTSGVAAYRDVRISRVAP